MSALAFDPRTLFLIGALSCLVCGVTLYSSRRIHRPSEQALTWTAIAHLLIGLGMASAAMRGALAWDWSIIAGNIFGPCGMAVFYEATRQLCHRPPRLGRLALGCAAFVILALAMGTAREDFVLRLQITTVIQGGLVAMALPLLHERWRNRADARAPLSWALGLVGLVVGVHLIRVLALVVQGGSVLGNSDSFASGTIQTAITACFSLVPMIHAMVMMALVNSRIANDLRRIATTDELTGLANRRAFYQHTRTRLAQSRDPIALLMLDLDWFKQVNDRYGHKIGDQVLVHFAQTLTRALGPADQAARYGGEEFCALLERPTDDDLRDAANGICDRVRANPYEQDGLTIPITVSIGMALVREGNSVESLISVADRRVYLAKAMGRDRVVDRRSAVRAGPSGRNQDAMLQGAVV